MPWQQAAQDREAWHALESEFARRATPQTQCVSMQETPRPPGFTDQMHVSRYTKAQTASRTVKQARGGKTRRRIAAEPGRQDEHGPWRSAKSRRALSSRPRLSRYSTSSEPALGFECEVAWPCPIPERQYRTKCMPGAQRDTRKQTQQILDKSSTPHRPPRANWRNHRTIAPELLPGVISGVSDAWARGALPKSYRFR